MPFPSCVCMPTHITRKRAHTHQVTSDRPSSRTQMRSHTSTLCSDHPAVEEMSRRVWRTRACCDGAKEWGKWKGESRAHAGNSRTAVGAELGDVGEERKWSNSFGDSHCGQSIVNCTVARAG